MALAIRLSRGGRRNLAFYRIVVADKRWPRDGRYLEKLGTYDPRLSHDNENRVRLVEDRVKYWLSQGAQPSERVAIFLGKAGILEMPKQPDRPSKSKPSEKTTMRIEEKSKKRETAAEAAKAAEEERRAAAEAAANAPPAPEPEAEAPAPADDASPAPEQAEAAAEETPEETKAEG